LAILPPSITTPVRLAQKKVQLYAWTRLKQIEAKEHDLRYLFWEATSLCNARCRHCGSDCERATDISDELKTDEIKAVFKRVADTHDPKRVMLAITGGEPTLRKDLYDVMGYATGLGFPWGMVTNGIAVNEDHVKRAGEAGLRTLTISLDGPEHIHDWIRGRKGSYKKARRAIEMFRDAGYVKILQITSVVAPRTIPHLHELLEIARELKVDHWRLRGIFPGGRAGMQFGRDLLMNSEDFVKLFEFIAAVRRTRKRPLTYYGEEGYFGLRWEREIRRFFHYCNAGTTTGGILSNGDIMACPSIPREFVQGNVRRDDFVDIWNNRFQKFRDRNWQKQGRCGGCDEFPHCKGGGLHLWDSEACDTKVCHFELLKAYEEGRVLEMTSPADRERSPGD
jgi:radical SAM protein with 4Fe4S-binding SPASM domain